MARSNPPWEGKDDNAPIPPRVKIRIKSRASDCCEICGIRVRYGGEIDHIVALANGGRNSEHNLQFLCKSHHSAKTRKDIKQKSADARTQKHLAGFKTTRNPVPGSKASKYAKRYNRATGRFETVLR